MYKRCIYLTVEEDSTFLFYVGLLRENNYVASDFPFTTALTRPNPGFVYDNYFLVYRIVPVDEQIHDKLIEWIKASKTYQKQASEKMDHIYQVLNNEKDKVV
jgi:hypothetical protein